MAYSTKNETVEVYKTNHYDYDDGSTECKWDRKYIIDNLPPWIYTRYKQPENIQEARGRVSHLKHSLADMDLQLEIRSLDRVVSRAANEVFNDSEWAEKNIKILKAKQTTAHVLAAYNYYIALNEESNVPENKFGALIKLLIEDPHDFEEKARELLY